MSCPDVTSPTLDPAAPTVDRAPVALDTSSTRGWHSPMEWMRWIGRNAKRIAVFVAGVTVLLAGVMMLVLPGPGLLVIILGLAILATEFAWAERALDSAKAKASAAGQKVKRGFKRS